jgi:hypothetical protein
MHSCMGTGYTNMHRGTGTVHVHLQVHVRVHDFFHVHVHVQYVYIRTRICIYTRTRTRTGTGVHRWVPCFLKDTRKSRFLKCRGVHRGDAQDARASPPLCIPPSPA